jgi:CRISPR-associated protein Cas1
VYGSFGAHTHERKNERVESVSRFRPRRFPYSSIIIDGHSGHVSLHAFHWLSRNKVPVFVMDYDGTIISILLPTPVKADLRAAQIQAPSNPSKKFTIAKALVQAKIARSLQVLEWLSERYDIEKERRVTMAEASKLSKASDVRHSKRSIE